MNSPVKARDLRTVLTRSATVPFCKMGFSALAGAAKTPNCWEPNVAARATMEEMRAKGRMMIVTNEQKCCVNKRKV